MNPITISADLANSIWQYLAAKPFAEVANLAVAFQQVVGPQMKAIEDEAKAAADAANPAVVTDVTPVQ